MFFPPQIILIPLFRMFSGLGLLDTLWPMIIVHIAMGIPICTLLMRNFFATVPNALREAAIVEGANEWQVLTRVALPDQPARPRRARDPSVHLDLERFPLAAHLHPER